ncbi:MAG: GTPase Era [Deltaproteobacteria bacterium]|nr:GTPase Era [Deltaproteobacteria bacterium]
MFKSGYIAILGAPNVGKSTLLNALLGAKLSIVCDKPQTTRQKFLGIVHHKEGQLLFLDTPGLHQAHKRLNQLMVDAAKSAIEEADLIYYMVDPKAPTQADFGFIQEIEAKNKNYFLLINKIDKTDKLDLLPFVDAWRKKCKAKEIFLISALGSDGIQEILNQSPQYLPEGPAYFPEDQITNRDMRYLASEIIREKLFHLTSDEIPYSLAVVIEEYKEETKINRIAATIFVEKESQKPIVVGRGGAVLKKVGQAAREELEKLCDKKVFLSLFVKVVKDWTKKESVLKELGY